MGLKRLEELRAEITSTDIGVLRQSLEFARLQARKEVERNRATEARATAMMAALGILVGLVAPVTKSVVDSKGPHDWLILTTLAGALLFLAKGLYYSIRVLWVQKMHRLNADTVCDFQGLSAEDSLREEIADTVWETEELVQPNTARLFWLNRCQRNAVCGIVLFMMFLLLRFPLLEQWIPFQGCIAAVLFVTFSLLFLLGDRIAERLGFWEYH